MYFIFSPQKADKRYIALLQSISFIDDFVVLDVSGLQQPSQSSPQSLQEQSSRFTRTEAAERRGGHSAAETET